MKFQLHYLVFTVFLLLIACTPPVPLDSGLFSGKPCKAPCYQSLTPGLSTANDVENLINSLSASGWQSRNDLTYFATGCEMRQISNASEVVSFNIEDGKLTFISLSYAYFTNLQELVAHLGPPEYFEAVSAGGPDGSTYFVEVYYPSQGMSFIVAPAQTDVGYIKPSMVVLTAQYLTPGNLLSYFTTRKSCFMSRVEAIAEAQREIAYGVQPWSGFGAVKVTP
jgi:hypothetical protein